MDSAPIGLLTRLATTIHLPVAYLASLTLRGWAGVVIGLTVLYLRQISTLSKSGKDSPCPPFGVVFRILYGLFGTQVAELVLGRMLHTPEGQPQAEQAGGTTATTMGDPELRVMIVPILGGAFGGNYSFLVWDENDKDRRAICVDPADPYPVLRAAESAALNIQLLLTTHWHFDHSSGNATLRRKLGPSLQVVASAEERGRTPAVNKRLQDAEVLSLGRLRVRGHSVPGHTKGSMVFEVFNAEAAPGAPTVAFTGDTLFCGGCGALFECSAHTFHDSLQMLVQRLRPQTRIFPGHEYTEMLLQQACQRNPNNQEARAKLQQAKLLRSRKQPSIPSTLEEELSYNPQLRASPQELAMLCGCAQDDAHDEPASMRDSVLRQQKRD